MNKAVERIKDRNVIYFIMLIFLFGGVVGFIYEVLFYRIDLGYFMKRGTTMGPWIPIYGFGSVFILLTTEKVKSRPLAVFAVAAVISGILEFVTGYILFHYAGGLRLWDYNVEIWNWLNIGGYVCFRSVLVFGAAGVMLQYAARPVFHRIVYEAEAKNVRNMLLILFALFVIDILTVSCSRLLLMH
ncbi:MAG: hypothetical protein ACI4LC_07825 [Emergencia sp.]